MSESREPDLRNTASWGFGPVLEVWIRLPFCANRPVPLDEQSQTAELLDIGGPYCAIEKLGNKSASVANWVDEALSFGIWNLGECAAVGVKILGRHSSSQDIVLAVPPAHISWCFGIFPWNLDEKADLAAAVAVHSAVITRIRRLATVYTVSAVLIQDEGWTYSLNKDSRGVMVATRVAEAARWKARPDGAMARLAL